jgi:murein DD-endopeptidase MepM/ murein hydrolase activator NlpD
MATIIERQRVEKRSDSRRHTSRSSGYNAGFMDNFSQKPVRKGKKSVPVRQKVEKIERIEKTERRSGFSFPVPSFATLAAAAGTVIIALAALNWENISVPQPENYTFQPVTDTQAESHTIQYAATGISDINSITPIPVPVPITETPAPAAAPTSAPAPTAEAIEADTSHQNHLITFEWQQYRVRRGDSVSAIAKKFDVSVGAIIASNDIRNARALQEGAVLKIPNIDGIPYQVKSGDSLLKIAASFNVPLEVILDINDIKSDTIRVGETFFIPGARMNDIDLRMSLGELFAYPLHNRYITSNYGMRRDPIGGHWAFHTGIDLRADIGTPVFAALDGVVSVVGENRIYGRHIILTHGNGYKTIYAHLNSYAVKQGDRVARGRKIAESGNTGYSTGPHLHFGVYDRNNKLLNPLELLK